MGQGPFVATVDLSLAEKLKQDLTNQGFTLSTPPYTEFQAKKRGVTCTLYSSGKLTVQGKASGDLIKFYLEPEILKDFSYSYPETKIVLTTARIGIDEAGKGDYYGPLCIGGVYADEEGLKKLAKMGVKDSKSMQDRVIRKMAKQIRAEFSTASVRIFPQKYNDLYGKFKNLNRMLAWGHATAIEELAKKTGCQEVIIDQFAAEDVVERAIKSKNLSIQLTQRHRGEEDVVVAAASMLARDSFLDGMEALSKECGIELPRGANSQVLAIGKQLVAKHGREILTKVAKLHFKTTESLMA